MRTASVCAPQTSRKLEASRGTLGVNQNRFERGVIARGAALAYHDLDIDDGTRSPGASLVALRLDSWSDETTIGDDDDTDDGPSQFLIDPALAHSPSTRARPSRHGSDGLREAHRESLANSLRSPKEPTPSGASALDVLQHHGPARMLL